MSDVPLPETVRSGDLRASLEALRDFLATALGDAPPREQAPLAAQLRSVLTDLDSLPIGTEESTVDDLARRRAARRADPGASQRSAVSE